eukprot:GFUD01039050.1.p1 GENE.GFUD01039050.1~~GFUD01039050.1.p1  ORF type:complete len:274 (+),score=52.70 GFUD01039050.1:24-845(+)
MALQDVITLNLRGEVIKTTRGTLLSEPGTLLAAMFDPEAERPPAGKYLGGAYFIDEDPDCFKVVLSWLKHREVLLSATVTSQAVLVTARYLQITGLVEALMTDKASSETLSRIRVTFAANLVGLEIYNNEDDNKHFLCKMEANTGLFVLKNDSHDDTSLPFYTQKVNNGTDVLAIDNGCVVHCVLQGVSTEDIEGTTKLIVLNFHASESINWVDIYETKKFPASAIPSQQNLYLVYKQEQTNGCLQETYLLTDKETICNSVNGHMFILTALKK